MRGGALVPPDTSHTMKHCLVPSVAFAFRAGSYGFRMTVFAVGVPQNSVATCASSELPSHAPVRVLSHVGAGTTDYPNDRDCTLNVTVTDPQIQRYLHVSLSQRKKERERVCVCVCV